MFVAAAPPTAVLLGFSSAVLALWVLVRESVALRTLHDSRVVGVVMRSVWLGVAVLGLVALVNDIAELRELL